MALVGGVLLAVACDSEDPGPSGSACEFDADCEAGRICHQEACVPTERLICVTGEDKAPAIQSHPNVLRFEQTGSAADSQTLILKNGGTCTLSIPVATIEGTDAQRFRCVTCEVANALPIQIFPGRTASVDLELKPGAPGDLEAAFVLQSNDPQQATLRIPLMASSAGEPAITALPLSLDFGFVAAGRQRDRGVQVLNTGTGSAKLSITSMTIEPAGPFSVLQPPATPALIEPVAYNPTAGLALTIRYAPTRAAATSAKLTIEAEGQMPVEVALEASDVPPDISALPRSIDFGTVMLGRSAGQRITIQNQGQAVLRATRRWESGPPTDLLLPRALPPELNPGAVFELDVIFQPTVSGNVQNTVVIESNDPDTPVVRVPVVGLAVASPQQVVSVEMDFDNDSSSVLDHDLRDVDMSLESPLGQVAREGQPQASWGARGTAVWSAPPGGEPERVVLSDGTEAGTYLVQLSYAEDCATLPTALAAMLLGIGTDALIDEISEGEVMLDPDELSRVVMQVCVERRAVTAHVKVRIDGVLAADEAVRLESKGVTQTAVQLDRDNGRFRVLPP